MLALGMVRLVMVKGTDYPEHLSEYGTHWNFFLTMSVLLLCTDLLQRFAPRKLNWVFAGILVSILHQMALSYSKLGAWTISNERSALGWISMNKEGLVSLPGMHSLITHNTGYFGIGLAGLEIGSKLRNSPRPSFQKALLWQAALGWLGLGILHGSGIITSRRLVR